MSKFSEHLPKIAVVVLLVGGAGVFMSKFSDGKESAGTVNVTMPQKLSAQAQRGERSFADNCAVCHGDNASGSDKGPPLVHNIYNPGHHGDESIFAAVRTGVRQHHWPYGNMPALPNINTTMTSNIIAFIREVQQANGIVYQQHRM